MDVKTQKQLLEYLGPEYEPKVIDGEPCLYRRLNELYEIEISRSESLFHTYGVYIWHLLREGRCPVEMVDMKSDIFSRSTLKNILMQWSASIRTGSDTKLTAQIPILETGLVFFMEITGFPNKKQVSP